MFEVTVPEITFWWTWLPLYVLITVILVGVILALITKEAGFIGYSLPVAMGISMLFVVGTLIAFDDIEEEIVVEAVVEQAGYTNIKYDARLEFVAENSDGEFISGVITASDEPNVWLVYTDEK